jgi:hypothetical protein
MPRPLKTPRGRRCSSRERVWDFASSDWLKGSFGSLQERGKTRAPSTECISAGNRRKWGKLVLIPHLCRSPYAIDLARFLLQLRTDRRSSRLARILFAFLTGFSRRLWPLGADRDLLFQNCRTRV